MSARQTMRDTVLRGASKEELRDVIEQVSGSVDSGAMVDEDMLDQVIADMVDRREAETEKLRRVLEER